MALMSPREPLLVETFGFHNLMHLVRLHENRFELPEAREDGVRISFRAQTALGTLAAHRELDLRARADVWSGFAPAR
jgi:hypothetical protein